MPTHLLIDFDGTLVEEDPWLKAKFLYHSIQSLRGKSSAYAVTRSAIRIRRSLRKSDGKIANETRSLAIFNEMTGLDIETYHSMCEYALSKSGPQLRVDDALEFLDWARHKYTLILATNPVFSLPLTRMRLQMAGIPDEWFALLTTSEQFHFVKPSPRYFQQLLDRIHVHPDQCLMIGNHKVKDLPAAQCGISVALRGPKPRTTVPSFSAFRDLIKLIEESND